MKSFVARYHASVKAGLTTIPAIVKEYSDEEAMEICILENLQRRDINPVEEAVSFGQLMAVKRYSIDDLVKKSSVKRTNTFVHACSCET